MQMIRCGTAPVPISGRGRWIFWGQEGEEEERK